MSSRDKEEEESHQKSVTLPYSALRHTLSSTDKMPTVASFSQRNKKPLPSLSLTLVFLYPVMVVLLN
jgi:hypothetical protein